MSLKCVAQNDSTFKQLRWRTGAYPPSEWPDKKPRKGWTSGGHSSSLGQSGVIRGHSSLLEQSVIIDKVSILCSPSSCPMYLPLYSSCTTCYSIVNHLPWLTKVASLSCKFLVFPSNSLLSELIPAGSNSIDIVGCWYCWLH
jgi:hypothetical protein